MFGIIKRGLRMRLCYVVGMLFIWEGLGLDESGFIWFLIFINGVFYFVIDRKLFLEMF